jgi:flagella basal body P-ring formation protein FlgA
MYAIKYVPLAVRARISTVDSAMVARAFLTAVAFGLLTLPVMAEGAPQRLRLRGDVTARGDVLTLGDLVEGSSANLSARPLFRAPSLGTSGTIQARRIAEAVTALGLGEIETGGRAQVTVQRAARRVGQPEIEAALKRALETTHGLDGRNLAIRLDGDAPVLLAPVDLDGQATAVDLTYDPRTRRLAALVTLGDRQASLRVTGQAHEVRDVVVLGRALNRGETVTAADFTVERRPKEAVPADARSGATDMLGQVAQRGLSVGSVLRSGDLAPPDLVTRGETVTVVFDSPGLALSLRGQANEGGRLGATITVINPVSKKVLAATIVGPGRVSVAPAGAPVMRQASAALDGAR